MFEPAARKRRLFVGIDLNPQARDACARILEELRKTGFAAKYEEAEKLHVTLAFLGFVEPSRYEEIVSKLVEVGARSKAFSFLLDKLAAFPHERRPRVVYIGAHEQGAPFRMLAGELRNGYVPLGFEFRNDSVAHVTIAKVKEAKRPLPLIELVPIPLEVRELVLFESLPNPAHRTSRYERLLTAPCRS
ncbi:MAG TPA: RNA 2',3'-cyclic phosphodiesterase [Candidatus Cybelea sp.]